MSIVKDFMNIMNDKKISVIGQVNSELRNEIEINKQKLKLIISTKFIFGTLTVGKIRLWRFS